MKYFAYASNMSAERMRYKGIFFTQAEPARAYGWKLEFNKRGELPGQGYANLVQASNAEFAEGVLYDIQPESLPRLDKWENCPEEYSRIQIKVVTTRGIIQLAEVYVALENVTATGLRPAQEYLNWILQGKEYLSADYYSFLSSTQTL